MATALGIANRALRLLGEPGITAFTDAGTPAGLVSDLFVDAWNEVLAEEDWRFLVKYAVLADHAAAWTSDVAYVAGRGSTHNKVIYNCILAASNIEPAVHASSSSYWETQTQRVYAQYTGRSYRYDLPTDLQHPIGIMPEYNYVLVADWLYSDTSPDTTNSYPRLVYLADVLTSSAAGPAIVSASQDRIPSSFERAVAARLAMDAALTITDNQQQYERARGEYFMALQRAQAHNAMENPGPRVPDPLWSDPLSDSSWNVKSKEPYP